MFNKVADDLRDRYEFARTHIRREQVLSQLALLSILAIAFLIRFLPYIQYNHVLSANDPYSQLFVARFINENGLFEFFSHYDFEGWYPYGRDWGGSQYLGTPLTAVIIHQLSNLIGLNIPLEEAAYISPGIFGVLTVLMVYFLGKEISGKRVGLFAAFFLSMSPGHIQRSMVGFFDNEALGIFLMLLLFYCFLRALKTGSLPMTAMSGVTLALLLGSWGAASYAIQLLALYTLVLVVLKRYSTRLLTAYGGTIAIGLSLATLVPRVGPDVILSMDGLIPLGIVGILLILDFYQTYKEQITNFPYLTSRNLEFFGYGIIALGFAFVILNLFVPIIPVFRAKFITVLVPFYREDTPILASVAEHLIVTWGSIFRNTFILVFLIPLGFLYAYRKPTERNIFLLVYGLTTLYFTGSMVRLILIFAPAAALVGAKALEETLIPYAQVFQERFFLSKRKRAVSTGIRNEHVGAAFVIIFLVLIFALFQGVTLSQQILQPASVSLEYNTDQGLVTFGDWYETFDWFQRETATTSVISSWWDYGYWERLANRTVMVDNATLNSTQIANIGAMLVGTPDLALKIASYYDIDYVVVLLAGGRQGADNDLGKVQWMVKIAEDQSNLAPKLGHPIDQENYFEFADYGGGGITGYQGDFFKSLIWAVMTEGVSETVYNNFAQNQIISEQITNQGFHPDYAIYKNIFKEAFMSTNEWVRVFQVDWDAAEQFVGMTKYSF